MNIPNTSAKISTSVQNIMTDLYASDFAQNNVDLSIDAMGVLNYTSGMKLRLTYVDFFDDNDIAEWKEIASRHGATQLTTRVSTSSGHIDLNIEYKGIDKSLLNIKWLTELGSILLISWSYHQLHLLNHERYPFPTVS